MSDPAPIDDILPGLPAGLTSGQTRKCPICKKPVDTRADSFPFCGKRCRTMDLAKWATGDYKFTRPIEEKDLDEE